MSDLQPDYREQLAKILNEIAETVSSMPAHILREEAIGAGEDPRQIADHVREVLLGAVRAHQQRGLREARVQYQAEIECLSTRVFRVPRDPVAQRRLLNRVFASRPQLRPASLTAQHRDFRELPDADVESYLRQLEALGALDDLTTGETPEDA